MISLFLVGSGRRKPIPDAVPKFNLPSKSIEQKLVVQRKEPKDRNVNENPEKQKYCFKSFTEVAKRIPITKYLDNWVKEIEDWKIRLSKIVSPYTTPKYVVEIDDSLAYTIQVYDWYLPEDHWLYKDYKRSVRNVTIVNLIMEIERLQICKATSDQFNKGGQIIHQVLRKNEFCSLDYVHEVPLEPYWCDVFYRTKRCTVLIEYGNSRCKNCISNDNKATHKTNIEIKNLNEPASKFAPVSKTNPQKIKLAMQEQRKTIEKHLLRCGQLEREIEMMRKELNKDTITIGHDLSNDLTSILSNANKTEMTPFMNLFWQQQKELFTRNPKGARFHPMIIKFCLSLLSKSRSAYDELRNSNILRLPSARTLIDYKNLIKPGTGFRREILDNLTEITKDYFDVERYIVILFDEMKIRSNLVFNKHTEELVGFLDLGDPKINYNVSDDDSKLASYVLCFFLRGISTNLKFSLAHFATSGVKANQMFPLFWEAVSLLQFNFSFSIDYVLTFLLIVDLKIVLTGNPISKNSFKTLTHLLVIKNRLTINSLFCC